VAVVATDAVNETNSEIQEARRRGIPVFRRPEALAAIVNAGRGIAIAGTHGKTTTTGMVASILLAADVDPTVLIGGDLPAIGGNARNGGGEIVLAESCEAYDGFLYLHPEIAVILNIEPDHLDYHGTAENVYASFARFLGQVQQGGTAIWCFDDIPTLERVPQWIREDIRTLSYSANPPYSDAMTKQGFGRMNAVDIELSSVTPAFTLVWEGWAGTNDSQELGRVHLKVPGLHNVRNAVAASSVAFALGIPAEQIIAGLEAFTGTGRRFERLGEVSGILIVDDYAHHPTEIRATLSAARAAYPEKRLIAVFQPHLYSRTRDFMDDFADALSTADMVYLTDIYQAREEPIPGVTSEVLAEKVRAIKHEQNVIYIPDKNNLPGHLREMVRSGDVVLTMGAGDIRKAGEHLLQTLGEKT
jgi:UDP-N-acetylmuramate--alanine ligase